MNHSEYTEAKKRIAKLNRRIAQLNRNPVWNFNNINTAQDELHRLQMKVNDYETWQLPNWQAVQALIWTS